MNKLLKAENVFIKNSVANWQEAIRISIQPLVKQGYCEKRYIDGVFENTEKYGPYYVLCENLALIHASKYQGAIETQLAITVLKKPIKFTEDGLDVRVLIGLVATDSDIHLKAIQKISEIFTNEVLVKKLLDATSTKQIYELFDTD